VSPSAEALLIVLPALNEQRTLAAVVREIKTHWPDACVLVVDDASEDQTVQVARAAGAEVLRLCLRLGAWGAAQAGLRFAEQHGYKQVVTMDADGQHHADEIVYLLAAATQTGADVVIGSAPERFSLAKRIAGRYFFWLTRLKIDDYTSGFRLYRNRAIPLACLPAASLLDYQDIGVLLLLSRAGMRLCETPTRMSERAAGMSRVFSSWFKVARYMLLTTLVCLPRLQVFRREEIFRISRAAHPSLTGSRP
jgi:glycosyltransferase involved in cell wall biosynthesis